MARTDDKQLERDRVRYRAEATQVVADMTTERRRLVLELIADRAPSAILAADALVDDQLEHQASALRREQVIARARSAAHDTLVYCGRAAGA